MINKIRAFGKFLKQSRIAFGLGIVVLLMVVSVFYLSLFKKGLSSGSLSLDCAYFRKLSTLDNGTIYLFLKNEGRGEARTSEIILDDIPLPDFTLSGLIDEGDMADSGLVPSLKVEEDDRVLWYYIYPNPVPPGKVAKVVVKCNFSPHKLISIAAEDCNGKRYRQILQPQNNPLRFTYIGFNKELNKVFLYLESQETIPLQIARIYLDGQDVTANSFRPWKYLNHNEKKCIEVNLKKPLTKGEFVSAKVITTDNLSTESLVRAFSFFPITTDSGNPPPGFNLDNNPYLVTFSNTFYSQDSSKDILYDVLDCPIHAHGTWRNAGMKAAARVVACRDNDPYHLTYMGICKALQEKGSLAFAEIADTVKENFVESSTEYSNPTEHPSEMTAQMVKDASSPSPWFSIVPLIPDLRIADFQQRIPTPEEARLLTYYAVSRGTKGIFYRLFPGQQKQLKNEVIKINQELRQLRESLAISEPVPLAACNQRLVESCSLQAGYDYIVLLLINHDTNSKSDRFTYKPKTNFTVKIKVPEKMKVERINEITTDKSIPIHYSEMDGEIIISIDKLNITRQFLIKTSPFYEIRQNTHQRVG